MIMSRFKIWFIDVIYWIALFSADIFVYIVLGMLLMSYDDITMLPKANTLVGRA
jgi:hypothetical protein